MGGFFTSAISMLLFFAAILLFRSLYNKYQGTSMLKKLFLGGILFFIAYVIFQIAIDIYSEDELELILIWLCRGVFAIAGFFLLFAVDKRLSVQINTHESINQKILAATLVTYLTGLFLPSFVATSIETHCANEHKLNAGKIIEAVNKYETSQNRFPDDLDSLIPAYIKEILSPRCFSVHYPFIPKLTDTEFLRSMDYWVMMDLIKLRKLDYHLKKCEWDEDNVHYVDLYLIVPTIDLNGKQRYDFSFDSWERIPYYYNECSTYGTRS